MTTEAPAKTRRPRRMAREPETQSPAPNTSAKPGVRAASKISIVIDLLKREQGATLDEMVQATSWLPHTTRAALTGLNKKGHTIEKSKRDDVTCYSIVEGN
jgi:hypothetical protein